MIAKKTSCLSRLFSASPLAATTAGRATAGAAVGAPVASAQYGVTGAGIRIGIVSDSFDALGTAGADEADGALPATVQVLQDAMSGHDEGRAMAEVAHGVAPGAAIAFSAAGSGTSGMAASIAALQAAGCKVICDDVVFPNEPFWQMGDDVEKAIASFTAAGGVYVTAASNAGPASAYEGAFTGVAATLPGIGGVTAMNFGTAAAPKTTDALSLSAGRPTTLDLQWAQPWASIDGTGPAYSLAFALYDPSGGLVKAVSAVQVGGDPLQCFTFTPAVTGSYSVAVWVDGGTDPGGTFKVIANNDASAAAVFSGSHGSGSVFGHCMDPQCITVGAADAAGAAAGAPQSEPFSAAGSERELYSSTGAPLSQTWTRHSVAVTGPDGVATTLSSPDFSTFFGTSCAAPAVAGVAALMEQADPSLDGGEVKALLKSTALAFGDPDQSGAGLVRAPGAVALARESNTSLHDDVFGHGTTALLWQDGKGAAALSDVENGALVSTAAVATPAGTGWAAVASGDFSGVPGEADLLWRNADGRLLATAMNGAAVMGRTDLGDPGPGWRVVGTGDFDGNGQSDVLLGNEGGSVDVMTMRGTAAPSRTELAGPGAGWAAAGIGDFDGDGRSDILWENGSGALAVWIMNGTSVATEMQLAADPGPGWSVAGVGDATGDGKADILLQNASTGALDLWDMNGTAVTSQTVLTGTPGPGWQAEGLGMFDASGRDGILFENAATGGAMLATLQHGQIGGLTAVATPGAGWSATLG